MQTRNAAIIAIALSSSLMSVGAGTAKADPGKLVKVTAEEIYVPRGFDNNDEVVVVTDGYLPNSCYKLTKPDVKIDHENKTITVIPQARHYDAVCMQVLVPFTDVVNLGVLPHGNYLVKTQGERVYDTLAVKESTNSGPDDALYAPIESITVDSEVAPNRPVAIIAGRFTNTCMRLTEVKVINSGKTFEILPMMVIDDQPDCRAAEVPFKATAELAPAGQAPMHMGRFLAHARSLNGASFNAVFSVPLHD